MEILDPQVPNHDHAAHALRDMHLMNNPSAFSIDVETLEGCDVLAAWVDSVTFE